jgi:hypothetical protein
MPVTRGRRPWSRRLLNRQTQLEPTGSGPFRSTVLPKSGVKPVLAASRQNSAQALAAEAPGNEHGAAVRPPPAHGFASACPPLMRLPPTGARRVPQTTCPSSALSDTHKLGARHGSRGMTVHHSGHQRRSWTPQPGYLRIHRRVQLGSGTDSGDDAGLDEHGAVGDHVIRRPDDDAICGDQYLVHKFLSRKAWEMAMSSRASASRSLRLGDVPSELGGRATSENSVRRDTCQVGVSAAPVRRGIR